MLCVPSESALVESDAPDPSAPSRLELQASADARSPSSASVAVAVNVIELPRVWAEPSAGEVTVTDPWRPFPVRYYVFALLFLVFDVEAAFLFPWAVIYRSLGVYGFVEMVIFVSILAVGLVYAWKKGALKWV